MIVHLGEFFSTVKKLETYFWSILTLLNFAHASTTQLFKHSRFIPMTNFFQTYLFLQSGEIVALKKVPLRKLEDGIPNTALRYLECSNIYFKILSASLHLSKLLVIFMLWQF